MLHNFHIKMTGPNKAEVFIDGNKVKGVTGIEFHAAVDSMPTVSLSFYANAIEITAGKSNDRFIFQCDSQIT